MKKYIGIIVCVILIAICIWGYFALIKKDNKGTNLTNINEKQNSNSNELGTNQNYSNTENINIATETNSTKVENARETSIQEQVTEKIKEENIDMIKIKVNNSVLEVKLEDNEATKSLVERLKNGDIRVKANEYGGFEKVGNLGFSLPKNDKNITTSAGDIVLYQGNQISIFYNSNSWSYTKLGKVQNVSGAELNNILGSGDVTLILSID